MKLKSEKTGKLIFLILICAVAAYLLYIMISYYTTDKVSEVYLNFKTDETNVMSSVKASYIMRENEGQLILETNENTSALKPEGMLSKVFSIESVGNAVSEATMTVTYDEKHLNIDEKNIKLMRIDENGKTYEYLFETDIENNTITAEFFGGGMWYIGRK